MSANVMCVTASGGMPVFSRHVGNVEPFSFSVIASLNGVHLFSKTHGVTVVSTEAGNSTILWKEYEESVVIIAVSILNDEAILAQLLDTVFHAMMLTVGIDDIRTIKNVERLKRDLRPCYSIIDRILECLDFGDRCVGSSTQLFNFVETIICAENPTLQSSLDGFVQCVNSLYGCLTVENCVAVATDAWWELQPIERKLLSHVIMSNKKCTAFDIPVFLPCKSPHTPFRLVGVCLVGAVWVQALCSSTPDLSAIEEMSFQWWSPLVAVLRSALHTSITNLPSSLHLHPSLLGFLLIDLEVGRYLSSCCSTLNKKEVRPPSEVLKTFYYQAGSLLEDNGSQNRPVETYWCSEYHKVHGLRRGSNILCLMYNASVPTHTMRLISDETLSTLISNEIFSR